MGHRKNHITDLMTRTPAGHADRTLAARCFGMPSSQLDIDGTEPTSERSAD